MKNLKKVLALVVALTMVLGTVAFAFTDVDTENDAYTAVQTLSSLGILNGYEDGTFGPEKDITRAEFAAVVCRALDMESSVNGAKGQTMFTDVPADHWATGYINLAAGAGIINGMGDGTFEPESNVTYEQAIKMLVVALGFEPLAAQKGGWPTGYLVVANQYGMTEGVKVANDTAAANRGIVAQLTYNALDIPMMIQTGFGSNLDYKIQDGTNNQKYQTLLTELDVLKLGGVVTATTIIGGLDVGTIYYEVSDNFDNNAIAEKDDISTIEQDNLYSFKLAEGVYVDEYFGIASEIFAKEVRNDYEIIAIMPGVDSEILSINKKDLAQNLTVDSDGSFEIEYYVTNTKTKTIKVSLDNDDIIYNNVPKSISAGKAMINGLPDEAVLQIINNNTSSAYDMIVVKEYRYGLVDSVDADKSKLKLDLGNSMKTFTFDFEDEEILNLVADKEGNEITLADFAEGDVVGYLTEGNKGYDFKWADFVNYGENSVTGTVNGTNDSEGIIYIDDVEYEVAGVTIGEGQDVDVNFEGIFYLTAANKVFKVEETSSSANNYAYILQMKHATQGFTDGWQIKLLTNDGTIAIYDVKDSLTYNTYSLTNVNDSSVAATAFSDGNLVDIASDAAIASNFRTDANKRLITFKLDSNGDIREIKDANVYGEVDFSGTDKEYDAAAGTLNRKVLEDDIVIFNIHTSSADNVKVQGIESLVDEGEYRGYLFENKKGEYDVAIITQGRGAIDASQDFAIIDSVSSTEVDDVEAKRIKYYTSSDSNLKEITVVNDAAVSTLEWGTNYATDFKQGNVIMFAEGADGIAANIGVIARIDDVTGRYSANGLADIFGSSEEYDIIAGVLYEIDESSSRIIITADSASGEMITIKGNVNAYTFNNKASRKNIVVDDWRGANEVADFEGHNDIGDTTKATAFFAKITDSNIVTDIVTAAKKVNR